MKPRPVAYAAASSVEEAAVLLAEHGEEAKVLAGGQSLVPLMNLRLASPGLLVDVARVPELRAATPVAGGGLRLGAAVVHSAVEDGRVADPTRGLLPAVAAGIGFRAVRNRGTVGGSLAHADPSAEWPVVMSALGATVVARSARGERAVATRSLFRGHFTTAPQPEEVLVAVDVPALRPDAAWGFHKVTRKAGEFAESLAVAVVRRAPDGAVAAADLWLGAARDVPVHLRAAEEAVRGRRWSRDLHPEVRAAVADDLGPPTDAEARYAVHLHRVATCRALDRALAGSR